MKTALTSRRLRLFLVPVALACALLAPAVASANKKLRVGFLDNAYVLSNPDLFWSEARELNVGFMRWDLQWKHVAPTKPRNPRDPGDPAYHWGETDRFVTRAVAEGLAGNIMFTLWATPKWAATSPGKGYTASMPKLDAWRNFTYAAAKRYSGTYTPAGATQPLPRITAWEAWNEPNGYFALRPQFRNGEAVSPRNYTTLLNAMGKEINKALPFKPTIVAGALYKTGGPNSVNPITFMRGMKEAGATFDVLSVHPYNKVAAKGVRDGASQSRTNPAYIAIGNLDAFVTLSNQIFGRKRPVWVTEFGWNTPAPGQTQTTVSFAQQAQFAQQSIAKMRQIPQVERLAWFLMRDDHPKPAGKWYTTLLNAMGKEINKALPFRPTIVAGALYKTGGGNSVNPIAFMRGMKAAGAKFDVLSVHPYNKVAAKGVRDGASQSRTNPAYIAIGNLDAFVTLSNQIFGRKRPVWVTEFGWNTPAPGQDLTTVSFAQQAQFAQQSIAKMRQIPQVERLAWFLMRDDHPKPAGKWYTTGLIEVDQQDKPSYDTWQQAARGLPGIG